MSRPSICLVSREVYPFGGGGIGAYVSALAELLAAEANIVVVTSDMHRALYEQLSRKHDSRLVPDVEYLFVEEPNDVGLFYGHLHDWSARVYEAIGARYGDCGPDLIEFPDYHAEGFVTIQAKRSGCRTLRSSRIVVRNHITQEMATVLNGFKAEDAAARAICSMERYTLCNADTVLWAGGDIHGTYERFYGEDQIAPARQIRHPVGHFEHAAPDADQHFQAGFPLRFLYFGRLERRKGVQDLVKAFLGHDSDSLALTLAGGDTRTAPLGTSMREQLELTAGGDERITFLDHIDRRYMTRLIRDHHVVVMPSRWECWPYSVLEALAANRPVLATPTGGHVEMIRNGVSGWLTDGVGVRALTDAVERLLEDIGAVTEVVRARGPALQCEELSDPQVVARGYRDLLAEGDRDPRSPAAVRRTLGGARYAPPLVSIVIPYFRMAEHVAETVESALAQTHPEVEVIVVNDGSLDPSDGILGELATRFPVRVLHKPNAGLGSARNAGIAQARGRYVFPLDADNVALPTFVERAVELLEADQSLAYVTSWSTFVDEEGTPLPGRGGGYQPLGNQSSLIEEMNVAGDATAVLPRRIFDIGFRYSQDLAIVEDWGLYRALHRAGHFGHVIPERLLRYRIREGSMYRTMDFTSLERLRAEMTTLIEEAEIEWVSKSG